MGDEVEAEVIDLLAAGHPAPSRVPDAYWRVIHLLVRDDVLKATALEAAARRRLVRWQVPTGLPPNPDAAFSRLVEDFRQRAIAVGADASVADGYTAAGRRLHARLPDVLGRIRLLSLFGSEEEVALRVRKHLECHYSLQPSVGARVRLHPKKKARK